MKSDLRAIPGVGPSIESDLRALGYSSVAALAGEDPEEIFRRSCAAKGYKADRCLLYVFREAVYFAENTRREPEKLRWWFWKDRPYVPRARKLEILARLARALNAAGVRWGVGGSLMLCLRGVWDAFDDIDLVVHIEDAARARACLDALATRRPPDGRALAARSRLFCEYDAPGGVEIDLMADMRVATKAGEYVYAFAGATDFAEAAGERIPLCALEDWFVLYLLLPLREAKARAVAEYWKREGRADGDRLRAALRGALSEPARAEICRVLEFDV